MSPISKTELKKMKTPVGGKGSSVDYSKLYDTIAKDAKKFFKSSPEADEAIFSKAEFNVVVAKHATREKAEWYKPDEGLVFSKERVRGICLTLEENYDDVTYNKYPRYGRLIAIQKENGANSVQPIPE